MPDAILDLLFWIVAFVALFFILRHLQKRKTRNDDSDQDTP